MKLLKAEVQLDGDTEQLIIQQKPVDKEVIVVEEEVKVEIEEQKGADVDFDDWAWKAEKKDKKKKVEKNKAEKVLLAQVKEMRDKNREKEEDMIK